VTRLSVVIPTYDTAAMTLRCCRAVLASEPAPDEVIVVDDGSADDTVALLAREVPKVRVVRMPSNRGFAPSANAGVAASNEELVLLLNSDALVDRDSLRILRAAFAADPRLGVVGAQLFDEDGSVQWSGGPTPTLLWMAGVVSGAGHLRRRFRRGSGPPREPDWVSGAALAFRREVWNAAGPLEERYRFYCQDIDFCLRARAAGWNLRLLRDARVVHARGASIAGDSALHYDPARLWPDLLDWGRARYGWAWSMAARMALIALAWTRIAIRKIGRHDRATTAALVRGARALFQSVR
jgi:GT2 family glycosyltransferase